MAFLDNSGDIILDAVLTKAGREKLSSGAGLNITRFACGDDEINYALYDKSHPSGSAYYDLEIMQTPVLEGFTQINANINYGLLSYTDDTLLYMPEMKRLEKEALRDASKGLLMSAGGIYYFAVNSETKDQLEAESSALDSANHAIGYGGTANARAIFVETGLDTTAISRDSDDYNSTLRDNNFTISVDSRFVSNVYGQPDAVGMYITTVSNTLSVCPEASGMSAITTNSTSANLLNYKDYTVRGSFNDVSIPTSGGEASKWTNMSGPGLSLVLFAFDFTPNLKTESTGAQSTLYGDYGKVNQAVLGSSANYDYIDTMVHITGDTTSVSLSIPIRIIRYNGA